MKRMLESIKDTYSTDKLEKVRDAIWYIYMNFWVANRFFSSRLRAIGWIPAKQEQKKITSLQYQMILPEETCKYSNKSLN